MRPVLFRGARVIDPKNGIDGVREVLVRDGQVAEVSERPIQAPDATVVDVSGKWLLPGFIDLHVHLRQPGQEGKETVLSGCRSAVAGGFTSVIGRASAVGMQFHPEKSQQVGQQLLRNWLAWDGRQ